MRVRTRGRKIPKDSSAATTDLCYNPHHPLLRRCASCPRRSGFKTTEKFGEFLAGAMKLEPDEKREQIVADAEGMMTDFIRAKAE